MTYYKKIPYVIGVIFIILLYTSCYRTFSEKPFIDESYFNRNKNLSVAVMPINNKTKIKDIDITSRNFIYGFLANKNYKDMELKEVNKRLTQLCEIKECRPSDLSPEEIGDYLASDVLLYTTMNSLSRFYALVYSQMKASVDLKLVDAKTKKIVYKNSASAGVYKISLPSTIFSLLESSIGNIWMLGEQEKQDVLGYLFRRTFEDFPETQTTLNKNAPKISSLSIYIPKNTLIKGNEIEVSLKGTPHQKAFFTIKGINKTVPMAETKDGEYSGTYTVMDGDNANFCLISAQLRNKENIAYLVRTDLSESFSIDTQPPKTPEVYYSHTTKKGLKIFYDQNRAKDVAKYAIFRKTKGEENFKKIAVLKDNSFLDLKINPSTTYFYYIKAYDAAGNESLKGNEFQITIPYHNATLIKYDINRDTIFYAYSSPYYIEKPIKIASSARLIIEPDTTITFLEKGEFNVEGEIRAVGSEEFPIKCIGSWNNRGFIVNSSTAGLSNILYSMKFDNFKTALTFIQGDMNIHKTSFIGNEIGVLIDNYDSVVNFYESTFLENAIALYNNSDYLTIDQGNFEKNYTAIKTSSTRMNVKDLKFANNIMDYDNDEKVIKIKGWKQKIGEKIPIKALKTRNYVIENKK